MLVNGAMTAYTKRIIENSTTCDKAEAWLKSGGTASGLRNSHVEFLSSSVRLGPRQLRKEATNTGAILNSSIPRPRTVEIKISWMKKVDFDGSSLASNSMISNGSSIIAESWETTLPEIADTKNLRVGGNRSVRVTNKLRRAK